jgi:hypothetical protein
MKKKTTFTAKGAVLGSYWGGGQGAYESRPITGNSEKEIIKLAEQGIKDGSLDNGMGFERLLGAALTITKTTSIEVDGKPFINREHNDVLIGNLTEEQSDFLFEVLMHYSI